MKGVNSKGVATERSPTIRVTRGDALRNLLSLVTDLGEKEGLLGLGENPNQNLMSGACNSWLLLRLRS